MNPYSNNSGIVVITYVFGFACVVVGVIELIFGFKCATPDGETKEAPRAQTGPGAPSTGKPTLTHMYMHMHMHMRIHMCACTVHTR